MADLERLIQAIDAAEQSAYGSDTDSDLQTDRAFAIDLYHGRNIEPSPKGRSQVVDRTVFETVQWILPSLCRIFANGDDIVRFQPFGPEDEEAAKQESDYLNYLVTQKNPWFNVFHTWAHDALMLKNGYCLAYIEEKLHTETERYERQSDEAVALLTQEKGVEVIAFESVADESEMEPVTDQFGQPMIDPMSGQPVMQPRQFHNLTIRRTIPHKKLCFKVLPPERTKVDINTDSFSLEHCDYFEYWDICTLSQLRSLGFDIPDDLSSAVDDGDDTEERRSRDLYSEETIDVTSGDVDPSMRRVRARMIWIRHDTDGDGIAELQQCYRVGNSILTKNGEPAIYSCSRIPVACITPNVNPHRHIGTSEADITGDLQRIKTAILRQGLDGLYLATNPRHAVSNEVNLDDMMVSRPGGLVRMLEGSSALPGEGHVAPIVTQNVFPDAISGLEYMDRVRESRTGISRQFAGIEDNSLLEPKTATEVSQLSTMAAQRVEHIARIFASGVEYLFAVAHELVLKHGHQAEVVKLRGQWTTVDPSHWKTGRDMRIVVGYGAGNKDALASRLMMILTAQKEAMAGGLRVANEQNVYEALVELAKASDFTAPQRFFTDPSTIPPQEPQPSEAEIYAGVEQAKLQTQEKIKAAEIDSQERLKQAELLQRDQEAQLEARVKIMLEEIKQGGSANLERLRGSIKNEPIRLETQKVVAESQAAQREVIDDLKAELRAAIEQVLDNMNAPREVIRGKDGRVAGVRVGGVERKVARDDNGRVAGLQ